jgi:cAMP-dependent protein kinase regulator
MSVSAEVFGKFNKQEDYIPPVHDKSEEQIKAIKQKMENNFMFSTLNPKDKKKILDAVLPMTKKAGDVIIKQGDDGDNFYLVEQGTLTCTKLINPDDKEETFLKEYVPGESFGELALLYNAPRAATIVCKSATCELWSLDRNTFNHIIKTAV